MSIFPSKELGPKPIDVELAVDADTCRMWDELEPGTSVRHRITLEQARYLRRRKVLEQLSLEKTKYPSAN